MKPLYAILILVLFSTCLPSRPKEEFFVGKWIGPSNAEIVLKANHTFTAQNLPVSLFYHNEKPGLFDGQGTWIITKWKYQWGELSLNFDSSTFQIKLTAPLLISGNGLLENVPPWSLFVWKEEEGGERYEFTKQ